MNKIKETQKSYRPNRIKVLFIGESPPTNGSYFYYGGNRLLREMRRALVETKVDDKAFLAGFKQRGWYLDDLVQTPIKGPELKKKCREARNNLASRIREYRPSIVVCLLRRIRED